MQITEPATMLTDYFLTVICLLFALKLRRLPDFSSSTSKKLWALGFLVSGLAAAVGGTFHGFTLHFSPGTAKALWNVTVFCLGAGSAFMIAGTLAAAIGRHTATARWLLSGLAVSAIGLVLLGSGFSLHKHFNHNDIYHCVQAVALYLFFRGAKLLEDRPAVR
jgi:MFS family permease